MSQLEDRIDKLNKKIEIKEKAIKHKQKLISSGKKSLYEIDWLEGEIKLLKSQIETLKESINKIKIDIECSKENNLLYSTIPIVFKQLEKLLCERWNIADFEKRERLIDKQKSDTYKIKVSDKLLLDKSDNQVIEDNAELARKFVLDAYGRILKITGTLISCDNAFLNDIALSGYFEGVNGKAQVESVVAGGYNVQKLHIRILVKPIK